MNDQIFAQFHALPISVKNVVSSPEGMAAIEALEERYNVVLAELILRLIVRDISLDQLSGELEKQQGMAAEQAHALIRELEQGLLSPLLSYLQKAKPATAAPQKEKREPSLTPVSARQTVSPSPASPVVPQQAETRSEVQQQRAPEMPVPLPAQQTRVLNPAVAPAKVTDVRPAPPANLPVAAESTQNKQPTTVNERQAAVPQVRPPQVQPAHIPAAFPIRSSAPVPLAIHEAQSLPGIALQQLERGRKSDYFMSAEDEEEVGQHRKRLATYTAPVAFEQEVNTITDALIAKFHLTFAAPALERRLRTMIASRLHNVRSKTELQEMLQRSVKIGGMQYDARIAEQIAAEADSQAALLQDLRLLSHPDIPKQSEPSKDAVLQTEQQPAMAEQSPMSVSPQESVQPIVAPAPMPAKPDLPTAQTEPTTQETAKRPMIVRRLQAIPNPDRPFLEDIRHPARPMDMTDELGALTLQEFRKLGSSADAAQKVLQKIALLTEESFLKRSEGIASWRNSEVYQLYLGIGRDSMISGKTVEQVIAGREQQGVQALSLEEFSTIADLNRQMRL